MPRTDHASPPELDTAGSSYWYAARRPLHILLFLAPLIIAYELCLALVLAAEDGNGVHTVLAHKSLLDFFDALGVADSGGLYLGGVVIVVVLFVWHLLAREPWRVEPTVVPLMGLEAVCLALPLLAVSHLIARPLLAGAALAGDPAFEELDRWSQMAISVAPGLYEELIFRMVLIAVLHTLLVDLARMSHRTGAILAIVVSAAAFTWYHDLDGPDGALSGRRVLFYVVAGLYFGLLYTLRGFGIVVGVHAVYDVMTVLLPGD